MTINITLDKKQAINLMICLALVSDISLISKHKRIAKDLYKEIDKQVFK